MKVVQESSEHHFLTFLEKVKTNVEGWYGIHIQMARKSHHDSLVKDLRKLPGLLEQKRNESLGLLNDLKEKLLTFEVGHTYLFEDNDIVIVVKATTPEIQDKFYDAYKEISEKLDPKMCSYVNIGQHLYNYQKISDQKFLSALRMQAYKVLADDNRVSSISVRRKRRADPVVMVVEDDRFTATYAVNILNKDYEVVSSKTGEEAILKHIEHAPDMVFLDIHLPGLDGHETLRAIKQADPDAFVMMLSVDAVKDNIVSASQRGAAGFLKKPFTKDRLLQATNQSPFIKNLKALRTKSGD